MAGAWFKCLKSNDLEKREPNRISAIGSYIGAIESPQNIEALTDMYNRESVLSVVAKVLSETPSFDLACVGTSIHCLKAFTLESLAYITSADIVYYYPPSSDHLNFMKEINANVVDLFADLYRKGADFQPTYQAIVEKILDAIKSGKKVTYASQGSPVFLSYTSIWAYRSAREQGFSAVMVPGVSSFELLICELCKHYDTYDIQIYNASSVALGIGTIDPHTPCLLFNFSRYALPAIRESADKLLHTNISKLVEKLRSIYPADHSVLGMTVAPSGQCQTLLTTLAELEAHLVRSGMAGTLFLPATSRR